MNEERRMMREESCGGGVAAGDDERKGLLKLRQRRYKLLFDLNEKLAVFEGIVGDDAKGKVLLERIKAYLIFSVQRLAHHALSGDPEVLDKQMMFLRCSIKLMRNTLDDLTALCDSAQPPQTTFSPPQTSDTFPPPQISDTFSVAFNADALPSTLSSPCQSFVVPPPQQDHFFTSPHDLYPPPPPPMA